VDQFSVDGISYSHPTEDGIGLFEGRVYVRPIFQLLDDFMPRSTEEEPWMSGPARMRCDRPMNEEDMRRWCEHGALFPQADYDA